MISNFDLKQCFLVLIKNASWEETKRFSKSIKWMNQKALPQEAYNPTPVEQVANVLTHAIWIVPSILASKELFNRSTNDAQLISALIYGATLIFLFSISTSFHCVFFCRRHRQLKNVLHRCDRAVIYVFIAGSYFPWLNINTLSQDSWASSMRWFVWFLAILGIIYQQVYHEKYKTLEIIFYLIMGGVPALIILLEVTLTGMLELQIGGILYIVRVIFFKSDGIIPFAHAIWHLFVAMAAIMHYYAILTHLYPNCYYFQDLSLQS